MKLTNISHKDGTKWIMFVQYYSTNLLAEAAKQRYRFPPLGLLYMSSFLRLHGYEVHIVDLLSFGNDYSYFQHRLKVLKKKYNSDPELIGFSVFSENVDDALNATFKLKQKFPNSLIVFGGAHAKASYKEILIRGKVDIVSLAEGEGHIIEILKFKEGYISIEKIRGIAYIKNKKIYASDRFLIEDLNILPIPDFFNITNKKYRSVAIIVSSRGCPGKCTFCASRQFSGSKYRPYSAERIFGEMMLFKKYLKIDTFGFMDDTFTALKKRTKRFSYIIKNYSDNLFSYSIKSRVDYIDDETLDYLKNTNCGSIHIGMESADNHILASLNKRTTVEQNLKAFKKITKKGITPECSFIIGNVKDTKLTIFITVLMVYIINKYFGNIAVFSVSTPYPGTDLAQKSDENHLKIIVKDWRRYDTNTPIYETAHFSIALLNDIQWKYNTARDQLVKSMVEEYPELVGYYKKLDARMKRYSLSYEKVRRGV